MSKNIYIGKRYVPKIMGQWDKNKSYESLSIVQYQGDSFTSKQDVPIGIEITNQLYWVQTGNYNAQLQQYKNEVDNLNATYEALAIETNTNTNNISFINNHSSISPDQFEGSDTQKLQLAINKAKETLRGIKIDRKYVIENSLILTNLDDINTRFPITFYGVNNGVLYCNKPIDLFTSKTLNNGDFIFNNVNFESESGKLTKIFNCNNIIRTKLINCYFKNVDTIIYSDNKRYCQSFLITQSSIIGGQGNAIDIEGCYDLKIVNCLIETRENFFNHKFVKGQLHTELTNLIIENNVIEGLTGFNMKLGSTRGTVLEGNYYEFNNYEIEFLNDSLIMGFTLKNNIRLGEKKNSEVFIKLNGSCQSFISENNMCDNIPMFDTTNLTYGHVISNNDKITNETTPGNIDTNRIISLKTDNYTSYNNGVNTELGLFKRKICVKENINLPQSTTQLIEFDFQSHINLDDLISVQATSSQLNDKFIICNKVRSNTKIYLSIKNEDTKEIIFPNITITVLQPYFSTTN